MDKPYAFKLIITLKYQYLTFNKIKKLNIKNRYFNYRKIKYQFNSYPDLIKISSLEAEFNAITNKI